jgi:hypothetical protein
MALRRDPILAEVSNLNYPYFIEMKRYFPE